MKSKASASTTSIATIQKATWMDCISVAPPRLVQTATHETRERTAVRRRRVADVGPIAAVGRLRGVDGRGVQAGKAADGRARPLSRRRSALRADCPVLL